MQLLHCYTESDRKQDTVKIKSLIYFVIRLYAQRLHNETTTVISAHVAYLHPKLNHASLASIPKKQSNDTSARLLCTPTMSSEQCAHVAVVCTALALPQGYRRRVHRRSRLSSYPA